MVVNANHELIINNSTLKACGGELWEGIVTSHLGPGTSPVFGVNNNSYSVNISNNSFIEDALCGVDCESTGRYTITGSNFLNNFVGIAGIGLDNATDHSIRVISNNNFTYTLTTGILPSYPGSQFTVASNTHPATGVSMLNNGSDQDVGPIRGLPGNSFSFLNCGIFALNSSVNTNINTFQYIQSWESSPAANYGGTGWSIFGLDQNNNNGQASSFDLIETGGLFYQIQNGIFVENMNLSVIAGNMINVTEGPADGKQNTAIVAEACVADDISIISNNISNAYHGISLLANARANQVVTENNVYLTNFAEGAPPTANSGIAVTFFTSTDNNSTDIEGNYINNGRAGIYVQNGGISGLNSKFTIANNTISMPATNHYTDPSPFTSTTFNNDVHGIYLNMCQYLFASNTGGFTISNNNIYGTPATRSYVTYRKCGITLEESMGLTIECNNISDVGLGLYVKGYCDFTILIQNSFGFYPDNTHANNYHIVLRTMPVWSPTYARMGTIGSPSNCLNNTFSAFSSGGYDSYTLNFTALDPEPFWDYSGTNALASNNGNTGHQLQVNLAGGVSSITCGTIPTPPPFVGAAGFIDATTAGDIINGNVYNDYPSRHAAVGLWLQQSRLFNELQRDSVLYYADTALLNFYDTIQYQTSGQFERIDSLIATMSDSANIGDSAAFTNILTSVTGLNKGLAVTYTYETNEQYVNQLYLNTLALGTDSFSTDDSAFITALAYECPLVGGKAVYKARAIYMTFNPNAWFDDNYNCRSTAMDHASNHNTDTTSATSIIAPLQNNLFKLVPNPAHNSCTLFYQIPLDTKATFTLFNSLGQSIQISEITGAGNLLAIETGYLQSGIYLCRVTNSTGTMYSNKLVIIK